MNNEIRWDQLETALNVGAPLRFAGSDREISEQFLLCSVCLRDRVYSGGQVGIDYEKLAMPSPPPGQSMGFGGWLMDAVPLLHELEAIYHEAVDQLEEWKVEAWVTARRPGPDSKTERQLAGKYGKSQSTIHRAITFVDRCLAGRLRVRGYIVRGDRR